MAVAAFLIIRQNGRNLIEIFDSNENEIIIVLPNSCLLYPEVDTNGREGIACKTSSSENRQSGGYFIKPYLVLSTQKYNQLPELFTGTANELLLLLSNNFFGSSNNAVSLPPDAATESKQTTQNVYLEDIKKNQTNGAHKTQITGVLPLPTDAATKSQQDIQTIELQTIRSITATESTLQVMLNEILNFNLYSAENRVELNNLVNEKNKTYKEFLYFHIFRPMIGNDTDLEECKIVIDGGEYPLLAGNYFELPIVSGRFYNLVEVSKIYTVTAFVRVVRK